MGSGVRGLNMQIEYVYVHTSHLHIHELSQTYRCETRQSLDTREQTPATVCHAFQTKPQRKEQKTN